MIAVEGLRVAFGHTLALDGVDLAIAPGITGLFGQNGSGKSTLLRTIAGLLRPTGGTVTIDGRPTSAADEDLRGRIGYAGHEPGLYGRLTVRENLKLFGTLQGVDGARADRVLEAVGLTEYAGTPAAALSAGLARRASVARALLHSPDVLLLDEPYANLDDDASAMISAAIQDWLEPERVAIIATHGAKRVKAFADAGIILRDGRVQVAGVYRRGEAGS